MSEWHPIKTAPKDGTPVLLKVSESVPPRANEIAEIQFVGANNDDYMEWRFAAPVGYGGIPDEWLEGWMPLPEPPHREG